MSDNSSFLEQFEHVKILKPLKTKNHTFTIPVHFINKTIESNLQYLEPKLPLLQSTPLTRAKHEINHAKTTKWFTQKKNKSKTKQI